MFLTMLLACGGGDHLPDVAWLDRASIGVTVTPVLPGMDGRPGAPLSETFHFFLLIVGEGGNSCGWNARRPPSLTRPVFYQAGLGREGEAIPASRTARIPVRKMPSNVPAPPIEATGAPSPPILSRLSRSAPISVPIEPPI